MVSGQTSQFHLRLEASAPRARPACPALPLPSALPHPSGLGPVAPGSPPRPRPLLHHPGAPVSTFSPVGIFFPLQLPELVSVAHRRTCSRGTLCARDSLMKRQASLALVCLPSPARTTGISHCFRQVAQPLCTHTLTCTLRPETCFFKPTDLHSPISQPSKCRMPLAAGLPIKTCFLGRPLCPRAARLCPAFAHLCQHSQAPLRLDSRDTTSVRPPWVSAGRLLPFPQRSQLCPEPAVTVYLHKYLVTLMSYVGEAQLTRETLMPLFFWVENSRADSTFKVRPRSLGDVGCGRES